MVPMAALTAANPARFVSLIMRASAICMIASKLKARTIRPLRGMTSMTGLMLELVYCLVDRRASELRSFA